MLVVVNRAPEQEQLIKIQDVTDIVRRYNPVTYTEHFTTSLEDTYNNIIGLIKERSSSLGVVDIRDTMVSNLYKSYKEGNTSLEMFKYVLSLVYLDIQAESILKKLSIGKNGFSIVSVDMFPKDKDIKLLIPSLDLASNHFENLFELLDRGLLSLVTFKESKSEYPSTARVVKDKAIYRMRVKYAFMKSSPSAYRWTVLYNLLRGCSINVPVDKKEDGTTTGKEITTFSMKLDRIAKENFLSRSRVGISIL